MIAESKIAVYASLEKNVLSSSVAMYCTVLTKTKTSQIFRLKVGSHPVGEVGGKLPPKHPSLPPPPPPEEGR